MDWITSFIPGGNLGLIGGAVAFILALFGLVARKVYKAGGDAQIAKGAKADEKVMERIRTAGDARPSGGVQHDPNNRLNR